MVSGGAGNGIWPLQQVEACSSLRCRICGIAVVLSTFLCAHCEPPPNGSQLISLAPSTAVDCIDSLVKGRVWESPGSRNAVCESVLQLSSRQIAQEALL